MASRPTVGEGDRAREKQRFTESKPTPDRPLSSGSSPICGRDCASSRSSAGINELNHLSVPTSTFCSRPVSRSKSSTCQSSTTRRMTSHRFPFGSFNVSNGSVPTRPETEPVRDIPDPVDEHQVRSKLVDCDREDIVHYSSDCNHIIVDKIVYDDPVCVAARNNAKTLVTTLWVHYGFDVGLPIDPTCRACPPTLSEPNPGFSSTCSSISLRPKSRASTLGTKSSTAPTHSCLFSAMAFEGQSPPMNLGDSYKVYACGSKPSVCVAASIESFPKTIKNFRALCT
ncbi:hypothetical protein EV2_020951 [Malus domestica]